MLIIAKRKFRFTLKDDKNAVAEKFTTKGDGVMEDAPEWIKNTLMFQLATKDGLLACVESAPIVSAAAPKAEAKPAAAPKPAPKKAAPKKTTAAKKK